MQAHSYNANFIEPSLQVQLANDKDKFDIWWYYTDLTNHAKLSKLFTVITWMKPVVKGILLLVSVVIK